MSEKVSYLYGHANGNGHARAHGNGISLSHRNSDSSIKSSTSSIEEHPKPIPIWMTLAVSAPFTAAAVHFCWNRMLIPGLASHLFNSSPTPFLGLPGVIHKFISANVAFIRGGLDPSIPPYLSGFTSSFTSCAIIPLIESQRKNAPSILRYPLRVGFISQIVGKAMTYPTWWSIFVSSGGSRTHPCESVGSEIHQYDAESIFLATLLGFVLPGIGFSLTKSPKLIHLWFFYPITVHFIRKTHVSLRRKISGEPTDLKRSSEIAYKLTIATYALAYMYAFSTHAIVMLPRLNPTAIKYLLVPQLSISGPSESVANIIYRTVQWEGLVTFVSSIIATLAFSRTKMDFMKLSAWGFLGTLLGGTGGELTAVWMWRERRMKREREALENSN